MHVCVNESVQVRERAHVHLCVCVRVRAYLLPIPLSHRGHSKTATLRSHFRPRGSRTHAFTLDPNPDADMSTRLPHAFLPSRQVHPLIFNAC